MEKLTKNDIVGIRIGETRIYRLSSFRACKSAACYAYTLPKLHPEIGVKYSCVIKGNEISITGKEA